MQMATDSADDVITVTLNGGHQVTIPGDSLRYNPGGNVLVTRMAMGETNTFASGE